jgi:hypothetical protein
LDLGASERLTLLIPGANPEDCLFADNQHLLLACTDGTVKYDNEGALPLGEEIADAIKECPLILIQLCMEIDAALDEGAILKLNGNLLGF